MLKVDNLSTNYYLENEIVKAIDGISFELQKGEILGILGESGSGKSTLAHSLIRLIQPPGKIVSGKISFNGVEILNISENEMCGLRGAKIAMIFQDPFSSLNPVLKVGEQIAESIELHQGMNWRDSWKRAVELLDLVQIRNPEERARAYPHQFSGGMRQRVMIAMAVACQPELLIADEPTTSLDVTIQAEILNLLRDLQKEMGLSIIYITHNFGIIKNICHKVIVMHDGKMVEEGSVGQIIASPKDQYTKKLVSCLKELNERNG